jgi:uncharacterized caspase-like protein
MDAPSGTFIAYAAAPGHTAQDGVSGHNSVFTGELVKAMAEPGVPLEQMYKRVIAAVKADTGGTQQPWSEASIQGDFYFHADATAPRADAAQIELAVAVQAQAHRRRQRRVSRLDRLRLSQAAAGGEVPVQTGLGALRHR